MADKNYHKKTIASHYFHVDNGGWEVSIEKVENNPTDDGCTYNLVIRDGYHGYSEHKLSINNISTKDLCDLSWFLDQAADKMLADSIRTKARGQR